MGLFIHITCQLVYLSVVQFPGAKHSADLLVLSECWVGGGILQTVNTRNLMFSELFKQTNKKIEVQVKPHAGYYQKIPFRRVLCLDDLIFQIPFDPSECHLKIGSIDRIIILGFKLQLGIIQVSPKMVLQQGHKVVVRDGCFRFPRARNKFHMPQISSKSALCAQKVLCLMLAFPLRSHPYSYIFRSISFSRRCVCGCFL